MWTALLALAATVSLTGCALLDELDPGPRSMPADGRVEAPQAGIALAFPDGWLLESRPTIDGVGVASSLGPAERALLVPLVAAMPGHRHDRCLAVDATRMVQAWSERPALDEVVDRFVTSLGVDRRWVGLESTLIDLPTSRAGRILRERVGESESVSLWIFTQSDAWFYLECVNHSRLAEDWRSIAQTVEFLPASDASSPGATPTLS